jgi:purine nucleoside permease
MEDGFVGMALRYCAGRPAGLANRVDAAARTCPPSRDMLRGAWASSTPSHVDAARVRQHDASGPVTFRTLVARGEAGPGRVRLAPFPCRSTASASAMPRPRRLTVAAVAALAAAALLAGCAAPPAPAPAPRPVKVLLVTMFQPEADPWLHHLPFDAGTRVPGLSADYPAVRCTPDDVCLLTTGMGHANAAASTLAVALSDRFDLTHAYVVVTGIAGIDPGAGTIGAAAWARWLVDFGLQQEFDARERPAGWDTGYVGIGAADPASKPRPDYRTEVFRLDEALLQRTLALTRGAALEDSDAARAYRRQYPQPAAQAAPSVLQCDTLGGDTWWHGQLLGERAERWTALMTDGQGRYCTTQQEDNATYEALVRAAAAGRVDLRRVAVLRTGANFDRPHPGQAPLASLNADSGGFPLSTANLYHAAWPLVHDIVARWPQWRDGVPAD